MCSTWVSPIIFAKILCYTGAVSKSAFADPDGSIKSYVPVNIASGVLVMFGVIFILGLCVVEGNHLTFYQGFVNTQI